MAIFNSLPQELITRITILSAEDVYSRHQTLLSLAQVSWRFTRTAQLLLWERMHSQDFKYVESLIKSGFGKDKIVKHLIVTIGRGGSSNLKLLTEFDLLLQFLNGVSSVESLTIFCYPSDVAMTGYSITSVTSLNSLRTLTLNGSAGLLFPPLPKLQSIRLRDMTRLAECNNHLLKNLQQHSLTLSNLELKLCDEEALPLIRDFMQVVGPHLNHVSFSFTDESIISSILPSCSAIQDISIDVQGSDPRINLHCMPELIRYLEFLPISVPLTSVRVQFYFSDAENEEPILFSNCLLPFINLPVLRNLTYLSLNNYYFGLSIEEIVEENLVFVEICEERGIQLITKRY